MFYSMAHSINLEYPALSVKPDWVLVFRQEYPQSMSIKYLEFGDNLEEAKIISIKYLGESIMLSMKTISLSQTTIIEHDRINNTKKLGWIDRLKKNFGDQIGYLEARQRASFLSSILGILFSLENQLIDYYDNYEFRAYGTYTYTQISHQSTVVTSSF